MGFSEVLCMSVAAALRIWCGWLSPRINIQSDSHLEASHALLRFGFIHLFFYFYLIFYPSLCFFNSSLHLLFLIRVCAAALIQEAHMYSLA